MGLKLLVASTPKTGNTWLRLLLSHVYRLPSLDMPLSFADVERMDLPDRWVGQAHYEPDDDLLEWGERENVIFLTTIRHPADALLSLYHYVRTNTQLFGPGDTARPMIRDIEGAGPNVVAYVRDHFYHTLHVSIAWMATGQSIIVRYEDLWSNTEGELARVIEQVNAARPNLGMPLFRVAPAVVANELAVLRRDPGFVSQFFRKGGVGGWVNELPSEAIALLQTMAPYPWQFRALRYSMVLRYASSTEPRRPLSLENPFARIDRFDDGTYIASILVRCYFDLEPGLRSRLVPLARAEDPNSYLHWLTSPAESDRTPGAEPLITELAAFIYRSRLDLQKAFPDPFGGSRIAFVEWLLRSGQDEHQLDSSLLVPVRKSYVSWANTPYAAAMSTAPVVTNIAARIRESRADLVAAFPSLEGRSRIDYLIWFLSSAQTDQDLDTRVVQPVRDSFSMWAAQPFSGPLPRGLPLTNLEHHFYQMGLTTPSTEGPWSAEVASACDPFRTWSPFITDLMTRILSARTEGGGPGWPQPMREDSRAFVRWLFEHDGSDDGSTGMSAIEVMESVAASVAQATTFDR